jgi:hypothetical protein
VQNFLYLDFNLDFTLVLFLAQKYWRESRAFNVGEIDTSRAEVLLENTADNKNG